MKLTDAFWDSQKGLMIIGSDGALRFTPAGRKHYAPLMAKYGFSLQNVDSCETFSNVMRVVNAGELDENTRKFEQLLQDPATTAEERALIHRVLGHTDLPSATKPALLN